MYLIGYDIGSSSVKAALVDAEIGKTLLRTQYPDREMEMQAPQPGWAEQHPDHDGIANAIMKFEGRKYNHTRKYPQEDIYNRLSFQQIEELRNVIVIEALEGLNVYLGTLRQGRKTVLFVSEGMSATLPVETKMSAFWSARVARWRSTALWHRLVVPPTNHFAKGGLL